MTGGTAHLDDIVVAVLRSLRDKRQRFTANRERIHGAFFTAKTQFPSLLGPLTFREKGFFPESLGLDQSLSNLEASRLLHRQNAAPLVYEIDPQIEECYARFVKGRLESRGFTSADAAAIAARLNEELGIGEKA
jgi:hypothetical protein